MRREEKVVVNPVLMMMCLMQFALYFILNYFCKFTDLIKLYLTKNERKDSSALLTLFHLFLLDCHHDAKDPYLTIKKKTSLCNLKYPRVQVSSLIPVSCMFNTPFFNKIAIYVYHLQINWNVTELVSR